MGYGYLLMLLMFALFWWDRRKPWTEEFLLSGATNFSLTCIVLRLNNLDRVRILAWV